MKHRGRRRQSQSGEKGRLLDGFAETADQVAADFPGFWVTLAKVDPVAADMIAMLRGAPEGARAEFLEFLDLDRIISALEAVHPGYLAVTQGEIKHDQGTGGA